MRIAAQRGVNRILIRGFTGIEDIREKYYMIKGREEGLAEGLAEGKEKEKIEIARKLLDVLDDKTISEKTGLELEKIKELRKEQ